MHRHTKMHTQHTCTYTRKNTHNAHNIATQRMNTHKYTHIYRNIQHKHTHNMYKTLKQLTHTNTHTYTQYTQLQLILGILASVGCSLHGPSIIVNVGS